MVPNRAESMGARYQATTGCTPRPGAQRQLSHLLCPSQASCIRRSNSRRWSRCRSIFQQMTRPPHGTMQPCAAGDKGLRQRRTVRDLYRQTQSRSPRSLATTPPPRTSAVSTTVAEINDPIQKGRMRLPKGGAHHACRPAAASVEQRAVLRRCALTRRSQSGVQGGIHCVEIGDIILRQFRLSLASQPGRRA